MTKQAQEVEGAIRKPGASINYLKYPELIFGISGPIGIDIDSIIKSLTEALNSVGYQSTTIKITDEIINIDSGVSIPTHPTFYNTMKYKMSHANAICRRSNDPSVLMKIALNAICRERKVFLNEPFAASENIDDEEQSAIPDVPQAGTGHHGSLRAERNPVQGRAGPAAWPAQDRGQVLARRVCAD